MQEFDQATVFYSFDESLMQVSTPHVHHNNEMEFYTQTEEEQFCPTCDLMQQKLNQLEAQLKQAHELVRLHQIKQIDSRKNVVTPHFSLQESSAKKRSSPNKIFDPFKPLDVSHLRDSISRIQQFLPPDDELQIESFQQDLGHLRSNSLGLNKVLQFEDQKFSIDQPDSEQMNQAINFYKV